MLAGGAQGAQAQQRLRGQVVGWFWMYVSGLVQVRAGGGRSSPKSGLAGNSDGSSGSKQAPLARPCAVAEGRGGGCGSPAVSGSSAGDMLATEGQAGGRIWAEGGGQKAERRGQRAGGREQGPERRGQRDGDREADRQADRQADRHTDTRRQKNRETVEKQRNRDRPAEAERQTGVDRARGAD